MTTVKLEDIQAAPQKTADPQLTIEMPNAKLPIGSHRFELTVEDDSGNQSVPAVVTVVVLDIERPTAVIEVRDASGRPVVGNRIPFGANFILSGKLSTDAGGGRIASYLWQLL